MNIIRRIDRWIIDYIGKKYKFHFTPIEVYCIRYSGFCHNCNGDINIDPLFVTKFWEDDERQLFWPISPQFCPNCNEAMRGFQSYKSLDVTKELEALKLHHESK